jgi:hypothetical protein
MSDFIDKVHSYDLFTLQSRIYKFFLFVHDIKSNKKSPAEHQAIIDLAAPTGIMTELDKLPTQGVYELRRGNIIPETNYETRVIKDFFPKLLNTFKRFDFSLRKDSFKTLVNLDLKEGLNIFKIYN